MQILSSIFFKLTPFFFEKRLDFIFDREYNKGRKKYYVREQKFLHSIVVFILSER